MEYDEDMECCGNCEFYEFDWGYWDECGYNRYRCDNENSENYGERTRSDYVCGQWEAEQWSDD